MAHLFGHTFYKEHRVCKLCPKVPTLQLQETEYRICAKEGGKTLGPHNLRMTWSTHQEVAPEADRPLGSRAEKK